MIKYLFKVQQLVKIITLFLVIASLSLIIFRGIPLSLDVAGGISFELSADKDIDLYSIREILDEANIDSFEVQYFGLSDTILISIIKQDDIGLQDLAKKAVAAIKDANLFTISKVEYYDEIDPVFPAYYYFLGVGFILILIWGVLTLRLSHRFANAGILVVIHDNLLLLAIASLFGIVLGIDFIFALLISMLFLINDCIFAYDRIRYKYNVPGTGHKIESIVYDTYGIVASRAIKSILFLLIFLFAYAKFDVQKYEYEAVERDMLIQIVMIAAGIRVYSSVFVTGFLASLIAFPERVKKVSTRNKKQEMLNLKPHPRRLGDPLYTIYPFALAAMQFSIIIALLDSLRPLFIYMFDLQDMQMDYADLSYTWSSTFFAMALLILTLPKIRPNALYLRSFRKDKESELVREYIEVAMGDEYRLAGIRDPSKRIFMLFRPIMYTVMCLRYAGAKFLNLEAGDDWLARLWVSIGEARIMFLDLRDLTDFVKIEAQLSVTCSSLDQVLFIVDKTQDEQSWREKIANILKLEAGQLKNIKSVVWDESNLDVFTSTVKEFAKKAPEEQGVNKSAYHIIESSIASKMQVRMEQIKKWLAILAGIGLIVLFFVALLSGITELVIVLLLAIVILLIYIGILLTRAIIGKYRKLQIARKYNKAYKNTLIWELSQIVLLMILSVGSLLLSIYFKFYSFMV